MRCQDIELLIIASAERPLSQEELQLLEQHLTQCESCACFQAEWRHIRKSIKEMPVPVLSAELDGRTRLLCLEGLKTQPLADRISASRSFFCSLPKGIKATLFAAAILTATALVLFFLKFSTNELQIIKTAAILTLVLQNAIMLIFAPIVIVKCRRRKINMGFV